MIRSPFFVASALTLGVAVPLYVLSDSQFQWTLEQLPLLLLGQFTVLLLAASWSRGLTVSSRDEEFAASSDREQGIVKWFNANKGFGFITADTGEDIFVHFRSIRGSGHRTLRDGQRVEFVVQEGEKGLQAHDVAVAR